MNRVMFRLCPVAPAKAIRTLRRVGAAALLASAIWAQNPADISLVLAAKSGKTQFRLGEPIEVELRFQSSAAGKYQVWSTETGRFTRQTPYDKFFIEPSRGVVDPLQDIFAQMSGGAIIGRPPEPVAVGDRPVAVALAVNQWLAIRQPGHYRITVETTRVVTGAEAGTFPEKAGDRRSAAFDLPGDRRGFAGAGVGRVPIEGRRRRAGTGRCGATTAWTDPRPQCRPCAGCGGRARGSDDSVPGNTEAARAMVRFFEHGPQAAQQDLHAGLFASPWRKEVIAALDEAIADSDVAVTNYFLGARIEFAMLASLGPHPPIRPRHPKRSSGGSGKWKCLITSAPSRSKSSTTPGSEKLWRTSGGGRSPSASIRWSALALHRRRPRRSRR